jgi:alpha-L-rhamnosidase
MFSIKHIYLVIGPLLLGLLCALGCQHLAPNPMAALEPTRLRCEYTKNPLGIDITAPRLSWTLTATDPAARGQHQSAYRVVVASCPQTLARGTGDLWDSGKVASEQPIQISYAGVPLRSAQGVFWKVRVWDEGGRPSPWSEPATWEMALLDPSNWAGCWIMRKDPERTCDVDHFKAGRNPLLRTEFNVDKRVKQARAYVSGLGYYELRLNGEKVGDHVLDPGWTNYAKRVPYSTYDVTDQLASGQNALGIMLGRGWYDPLPLRMWGRYNLREALPVGTPRAMVHLAIEYEDGSCATVVTGPDWKAGDGPIIRDSVYLGEEYDACLEQPGWDRPGFDDSAWPNAVKAEGALGPLRAQVVEPIRVIRTVTPVAVTEPKPGTYIFDMGENFSGVARLRVQGPKGAEVALRYGELLYPDGTLNGMTAVAGQIKNRTFFPDAEKPDTAWQRDVYVLKGEGVEEYTPRFTFHGFRYVEVTGFPGTPAIENLDGLVLHSDVASAGSFECSNELFNTIQEITRRTMLSNLFGVQSDCPHREKFGYGGDIVASSEALLFNFDMARFYTKAVHDLAEAVRPNGAFTETSPFVGIGIPGLGEGGGPIGWGTAHPLLLQQLHQYYGDQRLIEEERERSAKWLALLHATAKDNLLDNGIGDHESLVKKPVLSGTAFYAMNVQLAEELARIVGEDAEADAHAKKWEAIREAFNARFLKEGTGRYEEATQAAQAFALYLDLVPESERLAASLVLADDVMKGHDGHLTTGIFGTKYMLDVLSREGFHDVAYTLVNQRTLPGWGHMIERGATTLWEHWEESDNTYSHNHPMFGSVSEWFFKYIAGIWPFGAEGFDIVIIRPGPIGTDLTWAKGEYKSARGLIRSEWRIEDGVFHLDLTLPPGVEALVLLPACESAVIKESGEDADAAPGVSCVGQAGYEVGSGTYHFAVHGDPDFAG